jgi:hypothetical protein
LSDTTKSLKNRHEKRVHREVALGGWNPEVGAAGVKDDGEGRVDIPKVLHIHLVLEHDLIIRAI